MVTGDNIQTAKAIAVECGILNANEDASEPTVIEGKTFRVLSEKEREQVAQKITVISSVYMKIRYALAIDVLNPCL